MDTPHNFRSMRLGKYRAGGDEKLNINFMWPNQGVLIRGGFAVSHTDLRELK